MDLKKRKGTGKKIACIMLVALLIAPLIGFDATQNVTEWAGSYSLNGVNNVTTGNITP